MKPKISIITLGADDLNRATRFYEEGLGLPRYAFEGGDILFQSGRHLAGPFHLLVIGVTLGLTVILLQGDYTP